MKAVLCSTQAAAQKLSNDVDRALDMPWKGVFVGGGRHVVQNTLRFADVIKHPSKSEWAYPYAPCIETPPKGKAPIVLPTGATIVATLPPDWTPGGGGMNPQAAAGVTRAQARRS